MNTFSKFYVLLGFIVLLLIMGGGLFYYINVYQAKSHLLVDEVLIEKAGQTFNTNNQTDRAIAQAYWELEFGLSGSESITNALTSFRDIAANSSNTNTQRVQALNGINFAYTQSNFSADALYSIVFSRPPFSNYYDKSLAATTTDPIHPQNGLKVAAVEAALVKLNELSNSLMPNHYAISRMEIANVFAQQREAYKKSAPEKKQIAIKYADKIKPLADAFAALPSLDTSTLYPIPMKMQIMFAHASVLAFVGSAENNKTYMDRGEETFTDVIQLGDSYPSSKSDYLSVLNETFLAREFYAVYYWSAYKTSNPDKIKNVLQAIIDNPDVKKSKFYLNYLPSNKNTKVAPFTTLRAIALQMPSLKAFLEAVGWQF